MSIMMTIIQKGNMILEYSFLFSGEILDRFQCSLEKLIRTDPNDFDESALETDMYERFKMESSGAIFYVDKMDLP